MELVSGVQRVIVAMEHATREGEPKLVPECAYPLTGRGCVDLVVTDLGVIDVSAEGLSLLEIAPGFDPEEVQAKTAARLNVSPDLKEIEL
jgi:3-oxoacid CoA-transferase subunit B